MSTHEQVLAMMRDMAAKSAASGLALEMPSPSNAVLGTEYIAVDPGKSLTARFPFNARFTNPMKLFHGGFLTAAIDDVYGPLTYMAAGKPVVTIEMSTSFVRPFAPKDEFVVIKAEVVSQTKSLLVLKAEARTKEGKLVATSTTHSLVVNKDAK